jgi:hypothetical protein
MHPLIEAPIAGAALFRSRSGGFPLYLYSYILLDADSNYTADLDQVVVIRVTGLNGERFRLRTPDDIRRFLQAVSRLADEATP